MSFSRLKKSFIFLPIIGLQMAALISCAGSNEKKDFDLLTRNQVEGKQLREELGVKNSSNNTKITLAVRASDKSKYEGLAHKFNKYKKGQVSIEIMPELNMIEALQTKAATNNLPNVFLVDMSTMGEIVSTSSYVKPVIMDEIFNKNNKSLYDVKNNEKSYEISDFDKNELDFSSNKNNVQLAIPIGYSPAALMLNTTMIDQTKHIKSYVPIKDLNDKTLTQEEKTTGTKVLKDGNGKEIDYGLATLNNIQYYIDQSGNSSNKEDLNKGWLGWGVGNMFQRIYSVARSAMKEPQNAAAMSWKELYKWFPIWASADKNGVLENHKLSVKNFIAKYVNSQNKAKKELVDYLWNTFGGYTYINQSVSGFTPSDAINGSKGDKGEVEPFTNKQQLFMINAMWALKFAENGWDSYDESVDHTFNYNANGSIPKFEKNNAVSTNQVKVLSLPYTSVSVADALAISNSSNVKETLVAKRFIKYIFDTDNDKKTFVSFKDGEINYSSSPAEVVASKFSSSNKKVNNIITSKKIGQEGWYNGGKRRMSLNNNVLKASDIYRGVAGTAWQLTSDNFFSQIETQIRATMQSHYGIGKPIKDKWSYSKFKELIDETISNFMEQQELS